MVPRKMLLEYVRKNLQMLNEAKKGQFASLFIPDANHVLAFKR